MNKKLHILFLSLFLLGVVSLPFCHAIANSENISNPCSDTDRASSKYCIDLSESIGQAKAIRGETGLHLVGIYIGVIYKYAASIIGIFCVLVIVVSGVQMMAGGVSPDMVSQARNRIWQALLSLIILFLSAAILHTINPGFFTI